LHRLAICRRRTCPLAYYLLDSDQISVSTVKIMPMLCPVADAFAYQCINTLRIPSRVSTSHAQLLFSTAPLQLRSVHPTSIHPRLSAWSGIPEPPGPLSTAQWTIWCWTCDPSPSAQTFFAKYQHYKRPPSVQECAEKRPDDDRPPHRERHTRQRSGPTAHFQV